MMHLNKTFAISFFVFVNMFLVSAFAATVVGTNFDVRGPDAITTTVGKFAEVRIDVFNKRSTADSYTVQITGNPANTIEITNPSSTTQAINPNQNVPASSNIRTLTEDNVILTFSVTSAGTSETRLLSMPVYSRKLSLPEFGLSGLLQIVILSTVAYFLADPNRIILKAK